MNAYCIIVDSRLMASRLPRCLATLKSAIQRFPGRVEIRVVSEDANPRLARLSRRFDARFEAIPQPSVGARGNEAAHRSPAEALVFPAPRGKLIDTWLTRADALLSGQQWDAVLFLSHDTTLPRGLVRLWRTTISPGTLCVHRDWFERIGGFDPALDETAYQDLVTRLRACQARVLEVPI
ncbi:hypothetical protein L861_07270 [Litchfieldella anticariensis FP35 = DSM 16096]|uniref:Glycosyltransferase 2-like domain-containing protein n=1 Tax=Litchfieldella anticariensis (strain DSM 16096 / CECT 5854 / CIP 108499 / LMG 22089 / FP35) TaxID=1121939 RepID=S2KY18_LITA3|nr:glycosyltransferase family 2 protein [Halomonas anticariensis]EPC00289.1 hypothetical protein L861_07270 [Halomonas anticariensis FP35 = DSM 16096]